MTLGSYLKDRWVFLTVQGALLAFVLFVVSTLGHSGYLILLLALAWGLGVLIVLATEYYKKASYYGTLVRMLNELDQKYLLSEVMEEAHFAEGELLYAILQVVAKSMNDKIAEYKIAAQEYREYIETWVHEIKTPIASAKLAIENNPGAVTRSIGEELDKVEGFVMQALYYARSASVEKDYIVRQLSLKSVVNTVIRQNAKALIDHKVFIEAGDIEGSVNSDEKWLQYILNQVIANAIKYSGKDPKISFETVQGDQCVRLRITDNGIGIPPQDLPRVFEKGFTGENGRRYAKSTGMGLYLCKKLCDKLGLEISVQSEGGTTVTITFPKGGVHAM